MKEQLQNMHVIDVHAHPYVANTKPFTADEFMRKLSLSVIPEMFQKQQEQQLVFRVQYVYANHITAFSSLFLLSS